jgi:hypothetical protein
MVTVSLRRVFAAGVLVVSLTPLAAACGQDGTDDGAPQGRPAGGAGVTVSGSGGPVSSRPPGSGTPDSGEPRVAYFSATAVTVPGAHEVLHDRGELAGFAARFAPGDPKAAAAIRTAGQATDFSRSVLVGWTKATGCSAAKSAALRVSGDRVTLRVVQPAPPPECFAPYRLTVVFEVARDALPARPVFG